tara:strand:+ start:17561 stop:19348 length:1788 start_codon:yes stop_codon:yes gene_type:complete
LGVIFEINNYKKLQEMKSVLFCIFILLSLHTKAQVFLHTDGQSIVNGKNEPILLRGLGLGGWMVQEGYMLQTGSFAGPQYVIKQKISELIGEENTAVFYDTYKANGITKRDIDSLAVWGFNSVRLPMHYNLYTPPIEKENNGEISWLEEGFTMTDNLLKWCAENKMYLILDLHATPGGQGMDANISDYDNTKPSLWESEANQKKMIALWKKLASRYKDNPWIGGYDIINEPNWNFTGTNKNGCDETSNIPLRKLLMEITTAIREVDKNHIIFIEGNCWGNNYEGIFPLWDNNMVISFHKYWNYNTTGAIQKMLDYREKYNAPIWLGESGENSNVWFRDAIKLCETNAIGWAFWPMKKIENIAGVTSVSKNNAYETLRQYWMNGGKKPTTAFAKKALEELNDNYKIENVTVKIDVIDAMFRQVQTDETKAYKKHQIPSKIFATEYDLGTNEIAYSDTDFVNYRVDTGISTEWNTGKIMRNDGVDIQTCSDEHTNGYEVFDIKDGEWLLYTVNHPSQTAVDVNIRYSSTLEGGMLHFENQNGMISDKVSLPKTGSKNSYTTITLSGILILKGENKIKVVFDKGGFNLNYLEFTNINK